MDPMIRLVGPHHAVEILGIKLVGVNAENGKKSLFTLLFIQDHGIRERELKDGLSRNILQALEEAGIGVASATFEIVGLPPVRIESARGDGTAPLTSPGHGTAR